MASPSARRASLGKLLGTWQAGLAHRVLDYGNQIPGKNGRHSWRRAGSLFPPPRVRDRPGNTVPGSRSVRSLLDAYSHGRLPGGENEQIPGELGDGRRTYG